MVSRAVSVTMPISHPSDTITPALEIGRALARNPRNKAEAGFSLLEILVVLSIMAVALSVVGSAMMRSVEATRFDRSADAAIASLLNIRADAMLAGEPRAVLPDTISVSAREDFPQSTQRRLFLPEGWRVEGDVITISPSGICNGGALRLYSATGQFRDYILTPPKCAAARAVLTR